MDVTSLIICTYTYTLKSQRNLYRHVYANVYVNTQSTAYIRPQVSGVGVRLITAATMAGYHDLSEFKRGVIVDA